MPEFILGCCVYTAFQIVRVVFVPLHRYQILRFCMFLWSPSVDSCYSCCFPLFVLLALEITFFFLVYIPRLSPFLLKSLLYSLLKPSHKNTEAPFLCHKGSLSKPVSDISLSVKHSLKPFSELSSANKSHNPCPLPFCKTRQLVVSGALCGSSKGCALFLWRALHYPSVRVTVSLDQRGMEWRPPTSAHGPFTLPPTPCH